MSQLEEQDPFQFLKDIQFDVPSIPGPDLEDIPVEEPEEPADVQLQEPEPVEVEEPAEEEDPFQFLKDIKFTEPGKVTVQGPRSYTVENSPVRVDLHQYLRGDLCILMIRLIDLIREEPLVKGPYLLVHT